MPFIVLHLVVEIRNVLLLRYETAASAVAQLDSHQNNYLAKLVSYRHFGFLHRISIFL